MKYRRNLLTSPEPAHRDEDAHDQQALHRRSTRWVDLVSPGECGTGKPSALKGLAIGIQG